MIQITLGDSLRTKEGTLIAPPKGAPVMPHEEGLAVVAGQSPVSWVDVERVHSEPISCGAFAVSAVLFSSSHRG